MTGRPPKPDELHILEGTFRPDRHGDPSSDVVADGEPQMPRGLSAEAKRFWADHVPGLIGRGLAKAVDAPKLAAMCEWWADYRKASRSLARMKLSDRSYNRVQLAKAIAWDKFNQIASTFGFDPAARSKLRTPAAKGDKPKVMSRKRG